MVSSLGAGMTWEVQALGHLCLEHLAVHCGCTADVQLNCIAVQS